VCPGRPGCEPHNLTDYRSEYVTDLHTNGVTDRNAKRFPIGVAYRDTERNAVRFAFSVSDNDAVLTSENAVQKAPGCQGPAFCVVCVLIVNASSFSILRKPE
jgi:hypothetical protein